MKLTFLKKSKGLLLGTLLTVSCLGIAAVGYAEAKAFEVESVLRGSYAHTMRNEFFLRDANLYNVIKSSNSWGEVIAREESGMDGSVRKIWMIGDLKRTANDNFVLQVKREVIKKMDSRGNINMNQVKDVNYTINLYHRMESGVKLEWNRAGNPPGSDIDGEYITAIQYPKMSNEAAMYVLERFMNSIPSYRNKLQGSAMQGSDKELADVHIIKLVEPANGKLITIGTYQVDASGTILEYDAARQVWQTLNN